MRKIFFALSVIIISVIAQSCSLFGIHINVENPKKPGKIPEFSEEQILVGELTPLRSCFDVHYYDLALKINPDEKILDGEVEVWATAVTDFDSLQLDLHSNFEITSLIDNQTGEELKYHRKARAILIQYSKKKGDKFVLKVAYNGTPIKAKKAPWNGGFVWKKDKEKKHWVGVACEGEGASIWWPLKDHTTDEPDSMRMHFTVPMDLEAVSNGQFEGKETVGDYRTHNWFVSYAINTYNVSVYVGDFITITDYYRGIDKDSLELSYYVLHEHAGMAKNHFKQVKPILKLYEKRFGLYPWYRDGFKLVESPYAGMEHQTAIAYGNGYKNDLDAQTDYIILHEVAHEWWGNSVTAYDMADVWIQEGFATYAEALYMEDKEGESAYDYQLLISRIFINNKYSVEGIEGRRWFDSKLNADVYGKGAWILHSLRDQLENDKLFFDIIHTFYTNNAYSIVSSKDFIELVNKKTGEDWNWFFHQYLQNNFAPELVYNTDARGNLIYKWVNVYPEFNKLKVRVKFRNGTIVITPSSQIQKLELNDNQIGVEGIRIDYNSYFALSYDKKLKE